MQDLQQKLEQMNGGKNSARLWNYPAPSMPKPLSDAVRVLMHLICGRCSLETVSPISRRSVRHRITAAPRAGSDMGIINTIKRR